MDQHRVDADPDPNFHILMPIQIQIGIKTMPITCGSYPKFYTCGKIGEKIVLLFSAIPVTVFFLTTSCKGVMILSILDSILKFSGKKVKNTCAWNRYLSGSVKMMRIPTRPGSGSGSRFPTLDAGTHFLPRCGTREGSRGTAPSWPAATGAL